MSESEQTLAVVRQVFAAFDAHDLDAFRTLLHPEVVMQVGGGPVSLTGPEAVVAAVAVTLRAIPDVRVTVTTAFADGPHGVAEVVREGTHTGSASLPDGSFVPPSGRRVRLPECVVFTVRDGKITRLAPYTDMLDTARQLGMLPPGGGSRAP
jgi:steroid delta-isomerase-like uncharacterized protein